jgi:hypothetical protein
MIAKLRLIIFFKLTRPATREEKLRAVIVTGFCLLASIAQKRRAATAQSAAADLRI